MLAESKARVAQQEQDEKARFVARQAQSAVRTQSAERHRVAAVKQRSAELATKKVLQAEVREKAARLYDERLHNFAEHVCGACQFVCPNCSSAVSIRSTHR
jgi:hypothetical protein|eukprot:COSAG02_NODE_1946_length_10302_cov_13.656768_8_plen_101_part_00